MRFIRLEMLITFIHLRVMIRNVVVIIEFVE
jgi:hypothetical protein